jgi:hypothetical protein
MSQRDTRDLRSGAVVFQLGFRPSGEPCFRLQGFPGTGAFAVGGGGDRCLEINATPATYVPGRCVFRGKVPGQGSGAAKGSSILPHRGDCNSTNGVA